MKQIAKPDDKEALMSLYNVCFPGEEEYCSKFFDCVWKPEKTLIYKVNGQIVSMIQMFDLTLTDGHKDYSAYYIFGAATHPEYRGKSIMKELLSESDIMNCDKDFAVLIAANESLKSFYGKLGYVSRFSCGKSIIKAEKSNIQYNMIDISAHDFSEIENFLKKMNDIYIKNVGLYTVCKRSERFLFDDLYCREAVVYYTDDSYAVAEILDTEVNFVECMGKRSVEIAKSVIYENNIENAEAYFPGNSFTLGMYKKISSGEDIEGYLNLLFN